MEYSILKEHVCWLCIKWPQQNLNITAGCASGRQERNAVSVWGTVSEKFLKKSNQLP